MIRTQVRRSVSAAVDYFLNEPALSEEERRGEWIGRGARLAGLRTSSEAGKNPVLEDDLRRALAGVGKHGRSLCQRVSSRRPCAWDIVLTAHKSLSVAALCLPTKGFKSEGDAIKRAFIAARDETFLVLQDYAARRHNQGPQGARSIPTGSLVAASFLHTLSRHGDPLLHAHLLVMNATACSLTERWYGLQATPYYRLAKSFDAAFQHSLLRHLRAAGFEAQMKTVNRVQVATLPAVPEIVCSRLSRARQTILKEQNRLLDAGELARGVKGILRQARLIADRTRPSKAGLRERGQVIIAGGISRAEARQIVGLLPRGSSGASQPAVVPVSRRGRGRGKKKRLTLVRPPAAAALVLPPPIIPVDAAAYVRGINEGFKRLKPGRNFSSRLKAAVIAANQFPDAVFRDFLHVALVLPSQVPHRVGPRDAPDLTYRIMGYASPEAYQSFLANMRDEDDARRLKLAAAGVVAGVNVPPVVGPGASVPPASDVVALVPASPVSLPPVVPVVVAVPRTQPVPERSQTGPPVRVPTSPVPGERGNPSFGRLLITPSQSSASDPEAVPVPPVVIPPATPEVAPASTPPVPTPVPAAIDPDPAPDRELDPPAFTL